MNFIQRLIVLVGTPGSGKDVLIRAIKDLGSSHAQIVPKHTTRPRWQDDGKEMICYGDDEYNLEACDIIYENYGNKYGIESARIWEGLSKGAFQVVVVSDVSAINYLYKIFGDLMLLVYVHSEVDENEYKEMETEREKDNDYIKQRVLHYRLAFDIYLKNFLAFDHVLIYSGLKKEIHPFGMDEDLFDQIFRLFRHYERGDLNRTHTKPTIPRPRDWEEVEIRQSSPKIIGKNS